MKKISPGAVYLTVLIAIGASTQLLGWERTWSFLRIPTMTPMFADMRTVQAGVMAEAAGLDPRSPDVGDPWSRSMNYPRLWLGIGKAFGIQREGGFMVYCLSQLAIFVAATWLLLSRLRCWILLAAALSTAALLAIERANNDMLVFGLLMFSVLHGGKGTVSAALLLGSLLKVYPLLALPCLFDYFRSRRVAWVTAALIVIVFFGSTAGELSVIVEQTPKEAVLSYGAGAVKAQLSILGLLPGIPWPVFSMGFVALCLLVHLIDKRLDWHAFQMDDLSTTARRLLGVSAMLYVGTFLLGANFDYRLVFLIPSFPALMSVSHKASRACVLVATLLAMNGSLLHRVGSLGTLLNVTSKVAVFVYLGCMLIDWRYRWRYRVNDHDSPKTPKRKLSEVT